MAEGGGETRLLDNEIVQMLRAQHAEELPRAWNIQERPVTERDGQERPVAVVRPVNIVVLLFDSLQQYDVTERLRQREAWKYPKPAPFVFPDRHVNPRT